MDINITPLLETDMFEFSHSACEGGQKAGENTWKAALNGPRPLLASREEFDTFRDYVKEFGAWEEKEIAGWSENECEALFLQFVAGDVREAGADAISEIDWKKYRKDSKAGRVAGRMFKTGKKIYYSIGN